MRVRSSAMFWFILLFVVTAILALAVPPSPETLHNLHISLPLYKFIILTLLLPYGLIWFSAFYGYDQMQRYAHALRHTSEGKAFRRISDGLRVFAWGMLLTAILSLILALVRSKMPSFTPIQVIINHYAALAIALAAFTLIGDGAYQLAEFVEGKRTKGSIRLLILIAAAIGIIFTQLVITNHSADANAYYLSVVWLLATLVIPYIYAWTVGMVATTELHMYARRVSGVLYRQSLGALGNGLSIVIIASIASQYLAAAFGNGGKGLTLGVTLTIAYILLAVEALGFLMIALGAKRMKRIEEV